MTATAANILSGKTAYVAGSAITGTMTNRGAVSKTLTTTGSSYTIPAGYHNGSGKVTATITNLSAGNVKSGVTVGGVAGTYDPISDLPYASITIALNSSSTASNLSYVKMLLPNGTLQTLSSSSVGQTYKVSPAFIIGTTSSSKTCTITITGGEYYQLSYPNWVESGSSSIKNINIYGTTLYNNPIYRQLIPNTSYTVSVYIG